MWYDIEYFKKKSHPKGCQWFFDFELDELDSF